MPKPTHREVKFTKEEMEYELPDEIDFSKHRFVGRGREGLEMARRISKARGEEKRKLIESLPYCEERTPMRVEVQLEPDVAAVFKDSASVNKALRAFIDAMPHAEPKKHRKTA